jgi:hypothetical protein
MKVTKRNIVAFEPCGPIGQMIGFEVRRKPRGAMKRLLEHALFALLGKKYAKLAERYLVLRQEANRRRGKQS